MRTALVLRSLMSLSTGQRGPLMMAFAALLTGETSLSLLLRELNRFRGSPEFNEFTTSILGLVALSVSLLRKNLALASMGTHLTLWLRLRMVTIRGRMVTLIRFYVDYLTAMNGTSWLVGTPTGTARESVESAVVVVAQLIRLLTLKCLEIDLKEMKVASDGLLPAVRHRPTNLLSPIVTSSTAWLRAPLGSSLNDLSLVVRIMSERLFYRSWVPRIVLLADRVLVTL